MKSELEPKTPGEYYQMLLKHDWHFERSEDPRAYKEGQQSQYVLARYGVDSPLHMSLYNRFYAFVHEGMPKPEDPDGPQGNYVVETLKDLITNTTQQNKI